MSLHLIQNTASGLSVPPPIPIQCEWILILLRTFTPTYARVWGCRTFKIRSPGQNISVVPASFCPTSCTVGGDNADINNHVTAPQTYPQIIRTGRPLHPETTRYLSFRL